MTNVTLRLAEVIPRWIHSFLHPLLRYLTWLNQKWDMDHLLLIFMIFYILIGWNFLCLNVKMCVPDGESYLWASSGPGAPVPAASAHCAACSPNHSLLSRWSPPAEGTLSYRSTRSWTQTLGGTAPPHLRGSEVEVEQETHTNTHIFRALALCSSNKLLVSLILNEKAQLWYLHIIFWK